MQSRSGLAVTGSREHPVRRRVDIEAGDDWASAELEDDFHRLGVRVGHDGHVITKIIGQASRHPWQLCSAATQMLDELVGLPLSPSFAEALRLADARRHCTHLFDLAALAIASVARGPGRRRYDCTCTVAGHAARLELDRDGIRTLDWVVAGITIQSDDAMDGTSLREGFAQACAERLHPDAAEAALVLRRVAMIANGRGVDLDQLVDATPVANVMDGACFVLRRENGPKALRLRGSTWTFDTHPPLTPHEEVREWFSTRTS